MIYTFTLESIKGIHKPSRWACESLTTDVQENAATGVGVMMDGSLYAQTLDWGTKTISVSGSGRIPPNLDDVPMGELVKLHSAGQASMHLPADFPLVLQPDLDGVNAPEGYQYAGIDIDAFNALVPCRTESYYEPVLSALHVVTAAHGDEVLDTYDGEQYRRGGFSYCVIPMVYEALLVAYFPVYEGYITQPVKISTDNNAGVVSWSFEMVASKDRSGDHGDGTTPGGGGTGEGEP